MQPFDALFEPGQIPVLELEPTRGNKPGLPGYDPRRVVATSVSFMVETEGELPEGADETLRKSTWPRFVWETHGLFDFKAPGEDYILHFLSPSMLAWSRNFDITFKEGDGPYRSVLSPSDISVLVRAWTLIPRRRVTFESKESNSLFVEDAIKWTEKMASIRRCGNGFDWP